jgi:hypothetical protein
MKFFLSILSIFGIIGIGFVLYGFFSGGGNIFTFHVESTDSGKIPTYEETLQIERKKTEEDILYANRAMTTADITLCKMIHDVAKAESCHFRIVALQAIASGSIETCDTIPKENIATICRDSIYQNKASEALDPSLCSKISATDGALYCHENVDDKSLRSLIASWTLTEEKCKDFSPSYQQKCNAYISEQKTNITIETSVRSNDMAGCEGISENADKTLCLDTIYLRRALTERDSQICVPISDTSKREYCISQVEWSSLKEKLKEYIVKQDIKACQTLSDDTLKVQCNDTIIFSQIVKTKDANLCNKILNPDSVSICQKMVTQ